MVRREGSLWKESQTLRCRGDAIFTVLSQVVMEWKYRDVEDLSVQDSGVKRQGVCGERRVKNWRVVK